MQTYLTFSDAAKFADIARNIINGIGYGSNFNFWGSTIFDLLKNKTSTLKGQKRILETYFPLNLE